MLKQQIEIRWLRAGKNLAVFRGEDGRAHALDAYCCHNGANLAAGGLVKGSCLECPFHGWQFRGDDGKCTHIPYCERSASTSSCPLFYTAGVGDSMGGGDKLYRLLRGRLCFGQITFAFCYQYHHSTHVLQLHSKWSRLHNNLHVIFPNGAFQVRLGLGVPATKGMKVDPWVPRR